MSEIYITRSQAIASRLLGNEMMVMSVTDSTFFSLNEAATLIWESADGCTELKDIVERKICPLFEVDPEAALDDAREFVSQLSQHGILKVSTQALNAPATMKIPA